MRKISNKEKILRFNSVEAERDKLRLAVYDLAHKKFGKPVRLYQRDYDTIAANKKDASHKDYVDVSFSMRAMPLFLLHWDNGNVDVMTETEVHDMMREHEGRWWGYMLAAANHALIAQWKETK